MGAKPDLKDWRERTDLAKRARCDGEQSAIVWHGYEPGDAECSNCGVAFPPERIEAEGERIWCSHRTEEKGATEFCYAWKHTEDVRAGVAPQWAVKYTRERKVFSCKTVTS